VAEDKRQSRHLDRGIKRFIDVTASGFALLVLSPLLLIIVFAIRLSSTGPAIFRQKRLGMNAVPFQCYKFRTMNVGSPDLRNADGSTYNSVDDPRVTKVGRFLRRASLDELPQLLNVLRGDMSLVGPRPDVADALSLYTKHDRIRLAVRPGITGWAAIHGRNTLPLRQRRELDIQYVENFSLWLDFRILLRTVPYVLGRKDIFISESKPGPQC
jgi:undecaprenyl phosphate N,N'-diacetylbacillosamine 1-phosphate transferase